MISLIVAMTEDRVIGREGQVPWHLSTDLQRFKRLTMGHHMIMGRKTWETFASALPGRTSIVLSRQPDLQLSGATVVHDLESALKLAAGDEEVFVIGGAQIYELAIPHANRLYLSLVHADVEGDTFFPRYDEMQWQIIEQSYHSAGERDDFPHSFVVKERVR